MTLEPLSSEVVVTAQTLPLDADPRPLRSPSLRGNRSNSVSRHRCPTCSRRCPASAWGARGPKAARLAFSRCANSNITKVLVDGAPVNQPGGLIDFSNFTLDNIEKIGSRPRAESALYGWTLVAGVISDFHASRPRHAHRAHRFRRRRQFRKQGRGGRSCPASWAVSTISAAASDIETSGQGPNDAFRNRTVSGNFAGVLQVPRAPASRYATTSVPRALRANGARFGKYHEQHWPSPIQRDRHAEFTPDPLASSLNAIES